MRPRSGPGWMGIMLGTAVGFLSGIVLIVALGGVVHDHTRTVTRTTKAPPAPDSVTVPDLVGSPLDAAERQLSDLGLQADINGGGTFGVIDDSNWQVVAQVPQAHASVQQGSAVELDIERR